MGMKVLLVLLDGLGDRSYKVLENRTPLQAAQTPHLDRLARTGSNGLLHAALTGQGFPSETAHYLLFGYDPELFPGRGLLEAVGYDVPFQAGDVLSLAHLSGINWQKGMPILLNSRADIKGDAGEIGKLYSAITPYSSDGVDFHLHRTGLNDAILVIRGPVSPHISDCDTMMIASGALYLGLGRELGMTAVKVADGKDPGEDLRERIRMALADTAHDLIHVHTKAPDKAAHTKDPVRKRDIIESLDRGLDELAAAVEQRDDLLVVVTADHSTPSSSLLIHSGEPVPVCFAGSSIRRDAVTAFDEISAAGGCLGLLRGQELMLMILNYANRSTLIGHRLGPVERSYVPETYRPFRMK